LPLKQSLLVETVHRARGKCEREKASHVGKKRQIWKRRMGELIRGSICFPQIRPFPEEQTPEEDPQGRKKKTSSGKKVLKRYGVPY